MVENEVRAISREVREYLHQALPSSDLQVVGSLSAGEPLLLLTMPQMVAGFGFATDDIRDGYGKLYRAFKDKYSANRGAWEPLDLAFVMCVPANSPELAQFGPAVETDVYFCRKYVVPFNDEPVGQALTKLPFVPLFSRDREPVRPASAQTFLQQCGVPATLAKYVVVKGERSAGRIADDCIEGSFGRPQGPTRGGTLVTTFVPDRATTLRVTSLEIENFRAYRMKREFHFGAALTVLYGPNGFGKTSVFDAVDFAFTGDIGRLRIRPEDRFRRVANHLDVDGTEGTVALRFERDNEPHHLVRRVGDRKSARLDGVSIDRKAALEELTGWRGPTVDRVENLVSLFRATHLFSQEHQELATDFRSKCELASGVVSRLLAFEDYHTGRNKASDVCDVLSREIETIDAERESLSAELRGEEADIEALGRVVEGVVPSKDWDDAVSSLSDSVASAGLKVPDGTPDLATLRGWRGTFEARKSGLREQLSDMSLCLTSVERLPRRRAELSAKQGRVDAAKSVAEEAARHRHSLEETHSEVARKVSSIQSELTEAERELKRVLWLEETIPNHDALVRDEDAATRAAVAGAAQLQQVEGRLRALTELLDTQEGERSGVLDGAREAAQRQAEVSMLLGAYDEWVGRRSRIGKVNEELSSAAKTDGELALSEEAVSERVALLEDEGRQLDQTIKTLESRRNELGGLIAQIEGHIDGGTCPVCGEDHGSTGELLDRIGEHLGEDVAKVERLRLEAVRAMVGEQAERMDGLRATRRSVEQTRRELSGERATLVAAIELYEGSLSQFGVGVGQSERALRSELEGLEDACHRASMEWESRSSTIASAIDETRRSLEEATAQRISLREDAARLEADRVRVSASREALAEDERTQGTIGLGTPRGIVSEHRAAVEGRIATLIESVGEAQESRRRSEELLLESYAAQEASEKNLAVLMHDITVLVVSCREMEAILARASIDADADESEVLRRVETLEEQSQSIDELIKAIVHVEQFVDAATTKAAFSRLRDRVNQRRANLAELESRRRSYSWWLGYFRELQNLLSAEQDTAVSRFTEEYGSRTSAIQRRLRSVYGFDDVEIRSDESRILVRVSRQGAALLPTDYFSQSQQQTLLLGLFLTAAISQTWSTMAPIFLDDPVTHFDDLNTYAFLDLIDGLLNDREAGGRQFIVSTCDEKLLRLARRKFAYLDDRAVFYTFSGIDEDGPTIV